MIAAALRKAKAPSEVLELLTTSYDEKILSSSNREDFLYDLKAIPFDLRSEILYSQLINIFGAKLLTHIPESYKNDFLCHILSKDVAKTYRYGMIHEFSLKNGKGTFLFVPQFHMFSCEADPVKFVMVSNNKYSFLDLPTTEFKNPYAVEEYKTLISKQNAKERFYTLEGVKGGMIKSLKQYSLTSRQDSFNKKALKKIDKESMNVSDNGLYYDRGTKKLNEFKDVIRQYASDIVRNGAVQNIPQSDYSVEGLKHLIWDGQAGFTDLVERHSAKEGNVLLRRWRYKQLRAVYVQLRDEWDARKEAFAINEKEYKLLCREIDLSYNKVQQIVKEVADAIVLYHTSQPAHENIK
ncbi:MAG: hypothetical protein IJX25_03765 [Clostridia bacterium]|nr:hypothetical protein [Clostridia bacterium]